MNQHPAPDKPRTVRPTLTPTENEPIAGAGTAPTAPRPAPPDRPEEPGHRLSLWQKIKRSFQYGSQGSD